MVSNGDLAGAADHPGGGGQARSAQPCGCGMGELIEQGLRFESVVRPAREQATSHHTAPECDVAQGRVARFEVPEGGDGARPGLG